MCVKLSPYVLGVLCCSRLCVGSDHLGVLDRWPIEYLMFYSSDWVVILGCFDVSLLEECLYMTMVCGD